MLIRSMSTPMCIDLVRRTRFGHLGCCLDGQPYVVPLSFAYHEGSLYCCGTEGRKIEWMRSNPAVCVEVEEIRSRQDWETVVLTGLYRELGEEPRFLDQRMTAHEQLSSEPFWWQPAFAPTRIENAARPIRPLFFQIAIGEIEGHRAVPDEQEPHVAAAWPAR